MASSSFDGIKGDLECPMCLDTFTDPVTLNCGHSFCSNCLNRYVQAHATAVARKILPCSVCRDETRVPDPSQPMDQWMKQLKPSFTIKKLVERVNMPAKKVSGCEKCSLCNSVGKTAPTILWCSECEMSLCKKCSQQHMLQPSSNDHHLDKLNTKSKRRRSLTIQCEQHKELLKFHCRDCSESICSTCHCMLRHRKCKDIVPLDSVMGEMKSYISHNHHKVAATLNQKRDSLIKLKSSLESVDSRRSTTLSKIRNTEKEVIACFKDKFQKDVDEVNKCAEEEKSRLKSEIKAVEIDIDIFEQHSTVLSEVLEDEDSNDIYKTHEFCRSGSLFPQTDPDRRAQNLLVDVDYSLDLKSIKQMLSQFCKIKLIFEDVTQGGCTTEDSATLTLPVLASEINANTPGNESTPDLKDITVMTVRGVEAVIVTDQWNENVKCYHSATPSASQGTSFSKSPSVCKMASYPWGITQLERNRVMVSVPGKYQLVTLHVTPALKREKTTKTQEEYRSLEMMDNGQLLAGSFKRRSVDVLDVSGNTATIIKTLPTYSSVFRRPHYLTLNRQDRHIIVSDCDKGTVTCMTSEGNIVWTYNPPPGTKFYPCGVSTTQRGDVIVVDRSSPKIVILTRSGVHKTDLLTAADTEITDPDGVYNDDRGYLYITDSGRIFIYKVGTI